MRASATRGAKPWKPGPITVVTTAMQSLLDHHPHAFGNDHQQLLGWTRSRSWKKLLAWADLPQHTEYVEDPHFRVRRQFIALFKKFALTPEESGYDPELAATRGFEKAERRCGRVNSRFRGLASRWNRHFEVLEVARKYIVRTIGEQPDLPEIYAQCDFGGGASVGVHGNATNLGRKLLAKSWTVTPSALPYAKAALWCNTQVATLFSEKVNGYACYDYEAFCRFVDSRAEPVQHNKLSFVAKTAKVHRTIAVEPVLNGFLQKGVDKVLRRFLLRRGIDLSDQSRNQKLAYLGSLAHAIDPYVTLDLSSASDSISLEVVRTLLPPAWFEFLDRLRSPSYELNGQIARYNKFCSMGNGFCFPLETLIFAAIVHAAYSVCQQRPDFTVYGDDIIVRQNIALYVTELLKHCGFTINLEKSFYFGSFKESCGSDWLQGQDITPVYIRKRVQSLAGLITLHNSLYVNVYKPTEVFPVRLRQKTRISADETLQIKLLRHVGSRVYPEITDRLLAMVPAEKRYLELYRPKVDPWNTGFLAEIDTFMASPHTRWDASTASWVGKGIFTTPKPDDEFEHPLRTEVEYLAVLRGASSQQPLSLRRETKTRVQFDCHASVYEKAVHAEGLDSALMR